MSGPPALPDACERTTSDYFREIPGYLKPFYHYFNTIAYSSLSHSDCPLSHILAATRVEDYVLLKLDIDNTPVEEAMVQELLAHPEVLELVDEFFWEHHVNFKPMWPGWGGRGDRSARLLFRVFLLSLFTCLHRLTL